MNRTKSYHDLLDAFREDGCPVCRLTLAAVQRFMASVDYEAVGDPSMRERLRAAHGFCNVHAYQWLEQAHVLGTAVIYVDVLTHIRDDLRGRSYQPPSLLADVAARLGGPESHGENAAALIPSGPCPACEVAQTTEAMLTRTLLATLPEPAFRAAYRASMGLCLPHLRRALADADEAAFTTLRDAELARDERLLGQLNEIIRRHDYRFIGEPAGEERGAAARAVRHVDGASGIGCDVASRRQ